MNYSYNDILNEYSVNYEVCGFKLQFINKPTQKIGCLVKVFSGSHQERYFEQNGKLTQLPTGIAHVIEHLKIAKDANLLSESKKHNFNQNGAVSNGQTMYCLNAPKNDFYKTGSIFKRFLKTSLCLYLDQQALENELKIIKTEALQIGMSVIQESETLQNLTLKDAIGFDLNANAIGTEKSLNSITLQDIAKYYKINYIYDNILIQVVGDFNTEIKIQEFIHEFKNNVNEIKNNLKSKELFITDNNYINIFRNYQLTFPTFEIHQISTQGNVYNALIAQNSNILPRQVRDVKIMINWIRKVNIWNIAVQMFVQTLQNKDSKLRQFLENNLDINWDYVTMAPNFTNLGLCGYFNLSLGEPNLKINKTKIITLVIKALQQTQLYFDFETFREFYKLSSFKKHIASSISFNETFNYLMTEGKYTYAPICYEKNSEVILDFNTEEINNILQEINVDNVLHGYFIKED